MAVLRMSSNRRSDVGPGECFLLYTTPPEYGNVAEIYHSDLTVQFLLSKLEKRGSSAHPNIFQFFARRPPLPIHRCRHRFTSSLPLLVGSDISVLVWPISPGAYPPYTPERRGKLERSRCNASHQLPVKFSFIPMPCRCYAGSCLIFFRSLVLFIRLSISKLMS